MTQDQHSSGKNAVCWEHECSEPLTEAANTEPDAQQGQGICARHRSKSKNKVGFKLKSEKRLAASKDKRQYVVQSNLFNCIASVPRKFDALIQLCSYRICYELSHVVTSLGA
jgi:hypothetical protein